ncbi:hypothetical protein [Hymenobacter daeguensis]
MKKLLPLLGCSGALALASITAQAQTAPPVLNSLPAAPAPPPPGSAPAPLPTTPPATSYGTPTEVIGATYSVELKSGNTFIGVMSAATADELEFTTKDLGVLHIQRQNLKQLVVLTAEQARRGYDDVGNGNRLFFGPTARNLRKGEGYVQNMELFILNLNYGITDNFSMGAIVSIVPDAGSDNFVGLTPKLSFPVAEKVRAGVGAMLLFTSGGTGGVTYANATYGGADHNLTAGIGYGFAGRTGFSSTPVLMLGGATRVSRRISLINETYVLRDRDNYGTATLIAGIAGLRYAGPRIGGGLGLLYVHASYNENGAYGPGYQYSNGTTVPFAEITIRFGKIK